MLSLVLNILFDTWYSREYVALRGFEPTMPRYKWFFLIIHTRLLHESNMSLKSGAIVNVLTI